MGKLAAWTFPIAEWHPAIAAQTNGTSAARKSPPTFESFVASPPLGPVSFCLTNSSTQRLIAAPKTPICTGACICSTFSPLAFSCRHRAGTLERQSIGAVYLVSRALPPIHHSNGHILCGRVLSHRIERISPGRKFLSQIAFVTCSFATRRIHNGTSITSATSTFGRSVHDADGRKRTTSQPSMYKI